ncbi:hypothetical protein PFBG_03135 [Plasmodium falciparum 7G8]|uniref:Uncharacterized protein n=2 Tax=Plasmodium falciparum TaxID=5833 RepID=A0A024W7K3_PLAFA|nr:hypothetical protein PFTANZ_03125 [Plasmodium falciparum Tanzania (2000708)]EUR71411.1 hypothetical protein PFBG_03135 [Plasmodium falciparum 7G8]
MLYLVGNNEYIRRTYKRYINLKNKHNEKNVLSINADEDKISNEQSNQDKKKYMKVILNFYNYKRKIYFFTEYVIYELMNRRGLYDN